MPLRGIKVLEFAGLAPGPLCGKILSDFGAVVTRIDRIYDNPLECLQHGKRTIAINMKKPTGQDLIRHLCKYYDVLIDPYRPGVMEKYNLGPHILMKDNPKLIYARLTGFGQNGPLFNRAGHDINYVALSGVLSFLGRKEEKPTPPINLIADFAGGGLLCALGICLALLERHRSGKGQIIDSSMVEGSAYIASWLFMSQHLPIWGKPRGENVLDTGAFYYDTYETKDGKYMSVGALEPQFYENFVKTLGLNDLSQLSDNTEARRLVAKKFLTKTQKEWSEIFLNLDACVFPVLDWNNAHNNEHNKFRQSFEILNDGSVVPKPAPRLSRTPGKIQSKDVLQNRYQTVSDILKEVGKTESEIESMITDGTILEITSKL